MPPQVATVLYVEDDPDDVFFLRRAFRAENVNCHLHTVSDVAAAKSYLGGKVPYDDRSRFPMPALVITDLTMPAIGESSLDLVSWIRSATDFRQMPVICANGADHPQTLARLAKLNVACHAKTSGMIEVAHAVKIALAAIQAVA